MTTDHLAPAPEHDPTTPEPEIPVGEVEWVGPKPRRRHRRHKAAEAAATHDRLTEVALKAAWDYVFVTRRGGRGDPDLTGLREALQALRVHQARVRRDAGLAPATSNDGR